MTALAQRLIERKRDGGHVEPGEWRALTSALLPTKDGPDRASIERAAEILIAEVKPEEDINYYFSHWAAYFALDGDWPWSERLKRLGLEPERTRY